MCMHDHKPLKKAHTRSYQEVAAYVCNAEEEQNILYFLGMQPPIALILHEICVNLGVTAVAFQAHNVLKHIFKP